MWFRAVLVVSYFTLFKSGLADKTNAAKAVSGPYTMTPKYVRNCSDPKLPYVDEPMLQYNVKIRNNLISGNLTVLKELKNYMTSIEDYYYENGRRVLTFQVKKLTCFSRFNTYLIKIAGINIDRKTCAVPKSTYSFSVDMNKVEHMWTKSREYGLMTRRYEVYNKTRTTACFEYDFEVKPKKVLDNEENALQLLPTYNTVCFGYIIESLPLSC